MAIAKIVKKYKLEEQPNDFQYWQSQPFEDRLATLEQIRQEYQQWKYGTQPRFQRIYSIIKQQ
jgi:hypothetical protein